MTNWKMALSVELFQVAKSCKGVIAFGKSLKQCENELQSVLEEWVLLGLKLGHPLPILSQYSLNQESNYESVATL
jgi:predicted RNase H-like HicB family nuclease